MQVPPEGQNALQGPVRDAPKRPPVLRMFEAAAPQAKSNVCVGYRGYGGLWRELPLRRCHAGSGLTAVRFKLRRGVRLATAAPCVFYRHPRQTLSNRASPHRPSEELGLQFSLLFMNGAPDRIRTCGGGQRRGPTAARARSLTSCPDNEERTGIRFEKERV